MRMIPIQKTLRHNSPLVSTSPHEWCCLVVAEERLHLVVLLQLGIHNDGVDAPLDAVLVEVLEQQHRDATLLILGHHPHDQGLQGVVLLQGLQDVEEAKREQTSIGFLHRFGQ